MSDKPFGNTLDDLAGKAKEVGGKLSGDRGLVVEGQVQQVKASLGKLADTMSSVAQEAGEKLAHAAETVGTGAKEGSEKLGAVLGDAASVLKDAGEKLSESVATGAEAAQAAAKGVFGKK